MQLSRQLGFSLLELLISLTLGFVISTAAISLFINTANSDFHQLKTMRLNQELRGIMLLMVREIRRAGYLDPAGLSLLIGSGEWNRFIYDVNNNKLLFSLEKIDNSPIYNCILFTSDQNANGALDEDEYFGYQRRYDTRSKNYTVKIGAKTATSCNSGNWESISDENTVNITELSFIPYSQRLGKQQHLIHCNIEIHLSGYLVSDPSIHLKLSQSLSLRNPIYDPSGHAAICQ
jgi:type II secretory pathway component PulJ